MQLVLATGAFAICFAVFGSVSAMMPILKKNLSLDPVQVSIALAIPVLLGSLGRIPLGMLTDRYGGRLIFSVVMAISIVPALMMGFVADYWQLIVCGFFIGIALASFSVGVGFVSGWYPPEKQGAALGVYGAGNIGQSLAAFGSPVIGRGARVQVGVLDVRRSAARVARVLFVQGAERRRAALRQKAFSDVIKPLRDAKSWVLSLYYFLTFGGFVAMAIYLPILLDGDVQADAGRRGIPHRRVCRAGTADAAFGGMLADRIGGRKILLWVFPVTAAMAVFLACPMMVTFTIGALGMAAAIGLGNGAVFKLVPEYFPQSVGAVTGLVGAAGGLGGFFPPLVLGAVRQATGSFTLGFVLLAFFAIVCFVVIFKSGSKPDIKTHLFHTRAAA